MRAGKDWSHIDREGGGMAGFCLLLFTSSRAEPHFHGQTFLVWKKKFCAPWKERPHGHQINYFILLCSSKHKLWQLLKYIYDFKEVYGWIYPLPKPDCTRNSTDKRTEHNMDNYIEGESAEPGLPCRGPQGDSPSWSLHVSNLLDLRIPSTFPGLHWYPPDLFASPENLMRQDSDGHSSRQSFSDPDPENTVAFSGSESSRTA